MDLPQYTSFLNADNMGEFWGIVKWFMFYIAPIVMIVFCIKAVSWFIYIIKDSTTREDEADEEEFEIYQYRD